MLFTKTLLLTPYFAREEFSSFWRGKLNSIFFPMKLLSLLLISISVLCPASFQYSSLKCKLEKLNEIWYKIEWCIFCPLVNIFHPEVQASKLHYNSVNASINMMQQLGFRLKSHKLYKNCNIVTVKIRYSKTSVILKYYYTFSKHRLLS